MLNLKPRKECKFRMKSKYKAINIKDALWGIFYALTPIVIPIGKIFSSGAFPSGDIWFESAMKSIPVLVVYLVVHFFKNSNGNVGKE